MKRIIAVSICMILCFNLMYFVSANDDVFEVTSLGIISGDEDGDLNLTSNMTRAEFAKVITMLMGWNTPMGYAAAPDVPQTHWASGYINLVMGVKVMVGASDGSFRPDDFITLQECVKVIVSCMGYDVVAEKRGGYPQGYLMVAYENGMLKGVSGRPEELAVRGDIVSLIAKSLDVPFLSQVGYGDSTTYSVDRDITFRKRLAERNETYQAKGIVTANYDTWLVRPVPAIGENQIEIDGVLFDGEVKNPQNYLGREVTVFYSYNDASDFRPRIINIELTNRNVVTKISAQEIILFDDKQMSYDDGQSRTDTKIIFDGNTKFYRNNRILTTLGQSDTQINNGYVEIIDNNGDEIPEYVFIHDYEDYLFNGANGERSIKLKRYTWSNEHGVSVTDSTLAFDSGNKRPYIIKDSEGNRLEPADILENSILSVFTNSSDTTIEMIVEQENSIIGAVEETSDDGIKVDGVFYTLSNKLMFDGINLGRIYRFYINFEGKIAYYTESSEQDDFSKYGYMMAAESKGMGSSIRVRMLTAGKVVNREEVNEADKSDTVTVPVTLVSNESVDVKPLAKRVGVYGGTVQGMVEASKLLSGEYSMYFKMPVRYWTNSEGEISRIELLDHVGGRVGEKIKFNAKEKVFGGMRNIDPFAIDGNTRVICIPSQPSPGDNDCLVITSIDNKDQFLQYDVQGYEQDPETKNVRLLVITREMYAEAETVILQNSSKIGLVEKVSLLMDEEGELYSKITILTGGEKKEYQSVSHSYAPKSILSLQAGDLVYYNLNPRDFMDNVSLIRRLKLIDHPVEGLRPGYFSEGTLDQLLYGYANSISFNEINNLDRIRVDRLTVGAGDRIIPVDIPKRNYPDVFIYTKSNDTVEKGSLSDILPYSSNLSSNDMVLLVMPNDAKRAVVIIREN